MGMSFNASTILQVGDISLWIAAGGVAIAMAGIILAVYFNRINRKFKLPAYVVTTWNLIQDYSATLRELQVSFKGKNLRNISVSKVAIWNDGTETIHRSDIAEADPLKVIVSDAELLESTVLETLSPANQFGTKQAENSMLIDFDYLDKNQGGIIQVVHTGKSSSNITLRGTLKGSRPISRRVFGMTKTLRYLRGVGFVAGYGALLLVVSIVTSITNGSIVATPLIVVFVVTIIIVLFVVETLVFQYLPKRMRGVPIQFESARQMV